MVVFGFMGAMFVDWIGVRTTAIMALSVAAVSRGVLAFCRSRDSMVLALLFLAPFGEAVLSTGIYTVALKKLTTPANRSFAFSLQYGIFNLAGALADVAADALRTHDVTLPAWLPSSVVELAGGKYWSGLRVHVFITWLAVLAALAVVIALLHDSVVVPIGNTSPASAAPFDTPHCSSSPPLLTISEIAALHHRATPAEKARGFVVTRAPRTKALPPSHAPSPIIGRANLKALQTATSPSSWLSAASGAAKRVFENVRSLCVLRDFWRALWLSLCLVALSKQWGDMDQLLPAFLERHYGATAPIYTIHSINMWVCMLGPSLVASLTGHLEAFTVMLPGMWVMAISPLWLAYNPSIPAAMAWVVLLSIGEVVFNPRQTAWVANLAPDGREGIFLALLSFKTLVRAARERQTSSPLLRTDIVNRPPRARSHVRVAGDGVALDPAQWLAECRFPAKLRHLPRPPRPLLRDGRDAQCHARCLPHCRWGGLHGCGV